MSFGTFERWCFGHGEGRGRSMLGVLKKLLNLNDMEADTAGIEILSCLEAKFVFSSFRTES